MDHDREPRSRVRYSSHYDPHRVTHTEVSFDEKGGAVSSITLYNSIGLRCVADGWASLSICYRRPFYSSN